MMMKKNLDEPLDQIGDMEDLQKEITQSKDFGVVPI